MIEQQIPYPMFDMDMKPIISGDMVSMTSPKLSPLTAANLPTTMLSTSASALPPMSVSCNNNNNNNSSSSSNNHHHQPNNSGMTSMPPDALATPSTTTLCGACCGPICDQYIMRVVDTFYHERCLQCFSCSMRLMHSCFARNGKLYCRIDYERIYMKNNCLGCNERINSEELVMRTANNVFHLKCFTCVVCGAQLKKGEQYVVKQGQLFCRNDYEKEVEMLKGFNDDYYAEDIFPSKIDGRRGPKRPRTILNTQQRRAFKASFDISPKPCRKVRENLAKETGLSLRIVQVWFQNQRAKVKKIQKKSRLDAKTAVNQDNDSTADRKSETTSKSKNDIESDSDSYSGNGNADGEQKYSVKEEHDNEDVDFSNTLELCSNLQQHFKDRYDESNDVQDNENVMGIAYSTFQRFLGATQPVMNPIDRLYSMQNYYFRCNNNRPPNVDDPTEL